MPIRQRQTPFRQKVLSGVVLFNIITIYEKTIKRGGT